eukprot:TRINITY_DN3662_c0_g1_i1.p1 TRINITY_DN3662_c0_g1~~TRINITY_DN3662_c0_g1_i1.p1  ORF type:complete len:243 (+),score=94.29 TRINITY_DN3662_c0_g1_i1:81-809(+)
MSEFEKAVEYVNSAMKSNSISVSTEQQLDLYKYFKQAKEGSCNTPKPSWFDFVGKTKWESWKSLGNMSKEEAMSKYVSFVCSISPSWNSSTTAATTSTSTTSTSTGEDKPKSNIKTGMGPVFSTMSSTTIGGPDDIPDSQKDICYWASMGDEKKVKELLEKTDVNYQDEEGRTALVWACDRGNFELAKLLIEEGADVNKVDSEGMTPLHYAYLCDYENIITLLKNNKADETIRDNDGNLPSG